MTNGHGTASSHSCPTSNPHTDDGSADLHRTPGTDRAGPTSTAVTASCAPSDPDASDRTAPATVAIPAEALLPQLGESNPMTTPANARELVDAQLAWVPVEVALQLTPATVTPGLILGLAVGDILPLPHPHHRPLDVAVDGQRLASAAVGAMDQRVNPSPI